MYYISAMWISKSHAKVKGESLLFTSFFLVMSSKENQRSISHCDQFLMINKLVTKLGVRAL